MSQPPSSSDSQPAGQIAKAEMKVLLRKYFAEKAAPGLLLQFVDAVRDPFQDGKNGGFRMNPLWVICGVFALLALSVFMYFTLGSF